MPFIKESYFRIINVLIIAAGIAYRIIIYFQNRSLFIDEANVGRNIAERSFSQFFETLSYEQYAGPLFLIILKVNTLLLGMTEYALRLWPLIAGIISLILFYQLLKREFSEKWLWFPLLWMGFTWRMFRFSTEVKQYTTDIMVALALLNLVYIIPPEKLSWRNVLLWGIIGAILIWLSMPVVFILAGVGFYYFFHFFQKQNNYQINKPIITSIALWLLSFGVYYIAIINQQTGTDYLLRSHADFYIPLLPTSIADFKLLAKRLVGFWKAVFGNTALSVICTSALAVLGSFHFFRKNKYKLLLYVAPFALMIFAVGVKQFSLMPRITLFVWPLLMFCVVAGVHFLSQWNNKIFAVVISALLAVTVYNHTDYRFFKHNLKAEEFKPAAHIIKANKKPNELLVVHHGAMPAYRFYSEHHKDKVQYDLSPVHLANWDEEWNFYEREINRKPNAPTWVLMTNVNPKLRDKFIENSKAKYKAEQMFSDYWSEVWRVSLQ